MDKKMQAQLFEVSRAMRVAVQLSKDQLLDPSQAIRDLAQCVATLALALDHVMEAEERTLASV